MGRRIAQAFHAPFMINGQPTTIAASVGRARWPGDFQEPAELLQAADASMYEAKRDAAADSLLDRR